MAGEFYPKPWWDSEVREQTQAAKRARWMGKDEWRKEAAELRNMIKQKKRKHWSSFVEATVSNKAQDIWEVGRVAKSPCNRKRAILASLGGNTNTTL